MHLNITSVLSDQANLGFAAVVAAGMLLAAVGLSMYSLGGNILTAIAASVALLALVLGVSGYFGNISSVHEQLRQETASHYGLRLTDDQTKALFHETGIADNYADVEQGATVALIRVAAHDLPLPRGQRLAARLRRRCE